MGTVTVGVTVGGMGVEVGSIVGVDWVGGLVGVAVGGDMVGVGGGCVGEDWIFVTGCGVGVAGGGAGVGVSAGTGVCVGDSVGMGVLVGCTVAVGCVVEVGVSEVQESAVDARTVRERRTAIRTVDLGFKVLPA